mmetsp:Transcript_36689/g.103521  ORF Transcript_36689/g.103521 Transcript_36689/m.103521 type:complete len:262 (+) Transcript_36689:584-1369(+)
MGCSSRTASACARATSTFVARTCSQRTKHAAASRAAWTCGSSGQSRCRMTPSRVSCSTASWASASRPCPRLRSSISTACWRSCSRPGGTGGRTSSLFSSRRTPPSRARSRSGAGSRTTTRTTSRGPRCTCRSWATGSSRSGRCGSTARRWTTARTGSARPSWTPAPRSSLSRGPGSRRSSRCSGTPRGTGSARGRAPPSSSTSTTSPSSSGPATTPCCGPRTPPTRPARRHRTGQPGRAATAPTRHRSRTRRGPSRCASRC